MRNPPARANLVSLTNILVSSRNNPFVGEESLCDETKVAGREGDYGHLKVTKTLSPIRGYSVSKGMESTIPRGGGGVL